MSTKKLSLKIGEMSCVNCSNAVQKAVGKIDGVQEAVVNFAAGEGYFVYDDAKTSRLAIEAKIAKIGYKVLQDDKEDESADKLLFKVVIAAVLTIFIHIAHHLPIPSEFAHIAVFIAASITQFGCGGIFYARSYKALKNRSFDMNVLVALGTSAAYFYSALVFFAPELFPQNLRFEYFDGAAMIVAFILFGRFLEARAKTRATDFMRELLSLSPKKATLTDGTQIEIEKLKIGDVIEVKSGQNIALDGVIVDGEGEIDESMINGEAAHRYAKSGDKVIGGTILKLGFLKVSVDKLYQDTLLSEIIRLLKDANNQKMPIARLADKIASIFVPAVIGISLLTFFVWFALGNTQMALIASISVLIISCPCALGLATPIAIVAGVGRGAKEGIFIKNPAVLEIISKIKFAVFDKTGTLTKANLQVQICTLNPQNLDIVASLEKKSEHPISYAIRRFAISKGSTDALEIEKINIRAGYGISGEYDGKLAAVGTLRLMEELGVLIDDEQLSLYQKSMQSGNTLILCAYDGKFCGIISLKDEIKSGAKSLIEYLKARNIKPVMLTGDKASAAESTAFEIGIESFKGDLLPQEKFAAIKELQKEGFVLFVGDGINDSLSIKQANIGIAMNSGSDIAKESGDIIIINNELESLKKSIELSTQTLKLIKQNLFWAFVYNIIGIPLSAGVLYGHITLTPAIAGAAMSVSSVIVVLNSLRLRFKKL